MASASSLVKKSLPDAPKVPSTADRLDRLERLTKDLIAQGNQNVNDVSNHNRLIEALIELQGAEQVAKKMIEIHQRKLETEADNQEAVYTSAVTEGHLASVPSSSKTDIVVCVQQKNAEGTILFPTRVFGPVAAFPAETQKVLGFEDGKMIAELKVGQVIEMGPAPDAPDGGSRGTLTVLAIYEPLVKPEETIVDTSEETPPLPTDQAEQA